MNIAAIKAAVEGAEKLNASQLEFAKDRIIMGTERKTMFLSEDSKKVFCSIMKNMFMFVSCNSLVSLIWFDIRYYW